MKWSFLLAVAAAISDVAFAGGRVSVLQNQARIKNLRAAGGIDESFSIKESDTTQEWILLPLDHTGKNQTKFWGRYWVYTKLWKPGAPIFFYDGGEDDASWAPRMLEQENSFLNQLIKKFNGMGIVWEHRYYGASTPVTITTATTPRDLQYLTVDQALADIPILLRNFSRPELGNYDLTPNGTPWIYVGGSYPGTRATFMREKYPDMFFASWAASAPVQANVDMGVYFEQIARGLNKWGFGNCTANALLATNYIDGELGSNDPNRQAAVKRLLLGPGSEGNPNGAIADALTGIFYNWQGYGLDGGWSPSAPSLRSFCDWISTDENGAVAPARGWGGIKDPKWVAQRWASWKDWLDNVNYGFGTTCVGPNGTQDQDTYCDLTDLWTGASGIAWAWQYCTQWGFYQQANWGPNRIISRYNDLTHQQQLCNRQFPTGVSSGYMPSPADVNSIVGEYGGWNARVSNVMFTGGEFDPWLTFSELSKEPFSPQLKVTQDIPECGQRTAYDTVFGFLVPDGCHCYDMNPYYAPGEPARQLFVDALTKWLKSWAPGGRWPGSGKRHYGN